MKRLTFLLLISLFFVVACAGSKSMTGQAPADKPVYTFVVFEFPAVPEGAPDSSEPASVLQNVFLQNIREAGHKAISPDMLFAKMKELNLISAASDKTQMMELARALNAEIVISGNLDYSLGPESERVDPDFSILLQAFDVKTGNEIWRSSTGRMYDWDKSPRNEAELVVADFLGNIIY